MKKKIIFGLAMIGASVAVLGGCGGATSNNTETTSETTTQKETSQNETVKPETTTIEETTTAENTEPNSIETAAKIGETVQIHQPENLSSPHSYDITVNGIGSAESIIFRDTTFGTSDTTRSPEEGNKFLLVNLTLKNTAKEREFFTLRDSFDGTELLYYDGYKFTSGYVSGNTEYYDNMDMDAIEVEALKQVDGQIAFDVPAEVVDSGKPLYLHMYTDPMVGEQHVYVKLR